MPDSVIIRYQHEIIERYTCAVCGAIVDLNQGPLYVGSVADTNQTPHQLGWREFNHHWICEKHTVNSTVEIDGKIGTFEPVEGPYPNPFHKWKVTE